MTFSMDGTSVLRQWGHGWTEAVPLTRKGRTQGPRSNSPSQRSRPMIILRETTEGNRIADLDDVVYSISDPATKEVLDIGRVEPSTSETAWSVIIRQSGRFGETRWIDLATTCDLDIQVVERRGKGRPISVRDAEAVYQRLYFNVLGKMPRMNRRLEGGSVSEDEWRLGIRALVRTIEDWEESFGLAETQNSSESPLWESLAAGIEKSDTPPLEPLQVITKMNGKRLLCFSDRALYIYQYTSRWPRSKHGDLQWPIQLQWRHRIPFSHLGIDKNQQVSNRKTPGRDSEIFSSRRFSFRPKLTELQKRFMIRLIEYALVTSWSG